MLSSKFSLQPRSTGLITSSSISKKTRGILPFSHSHNNTVSLTCVHWKIAKFKKAGAILHASQLPKTKHTLSSSLEEVLYISTNERMLVDNILPLIFLTTFKISHHDLFYSCSLLTFNRFISFSIYFYHLFHDFLFEQSFQSPAITTFLICKFIGQTSISSPHL